MAGSRAIERGVSQRPEMKPFWEVGTGRLQRVFCGEYANNQGYSNWIRHPQLPMYVFWHDGNEQHVRTVVHLRTSVSGGMRDELRVDDSVVILEEGAVTFVKSLTSRDGVKSISWARVSDDELETHTKRVEKVTEENILEAARMSETIEVPGWNKIQTVA